MPTFYREPESGETLREYLRDMLSTIPRAITGPGVSQGEQWATVVPPILEAESLLSPEVFAARIIGSAQAEVPEIECVPGPDGLPAHYLKGNAIDHPYHWLYAWEEVRLQSVSFDKGTGQEGEDTGTGRYIKVTTKLGGRGWTDLNNIELPGAAFNVWELLHKQDTEVCDAEQHWIFGVNIKQNQYPPNFGVTGWGPMDGNGHVGLENPNPQGKQDSVVLMNKLVQVGVGYPLYCFNAPGFHLGTCHG